MNVLIADKFESEGIDGLKGIGCTVTLEPDLADAALATCLTDGSFDVLVVRSTKVTAAMLERAAPLALIIRAGSGYNTIDIDAARQRGIKVANTPGMNATAVAELAMGLIIALDRHIVHNVIDLRNGVWNKKRYAKARGLQGRTLGIVGLGQIGVLIAHRAKAFEMDLIYSDVVANEKAERELAIRKVEFDNLLEQSDAVTLHVPLTDATRHFISRRELKLMKPTALLINCSRGGVVDEDALAEALESNRLGGAGLDVYEDEPGASDTVFTCPIGRVDRVYGTHHIGASTEQAQRAVANEVVAVVETFIKTGEVPHWVNP